MLNFILPLFLLLNFLPVCYAQTKLPEAVKENIKIRVDNGVHPAIVVGIIDGDVIEYYSYGVKSLRGNERADEHSIFEIGSITKTFTGIILADMVIKGKMSLDDPLQKYLPEG